MSHQKKEPAPDEPPVTADPKGQPVRLDSRCCGTLFHGSVTIPAAAAAGKAKVTLSFPAWKDGQVAPVTGEVGVINPMQPAVGGGTKE